MNAYVVLASLATLLVSIEGSAILSKVPDGFDPKGYFGGVRDAPYFPNFNPLEYCQYGRDENRVHNTGYGGGYGQVKNEKVSYYFNPEDPECSFVSCSNHVPVVLSCPPGTINTFAGMDGFEFKYDFPVCNGFDSYNKCGRGKTYH